MHDSHRIDAIAWRARESVTHEARLEALLRLLLHDTDHRLWVVQATYEFCATRAEEHEAWDRTARSVLVAMQTGLFTADATGGDQRSPRPPE